MAIEQFKGLSPEELRLSWQARALVATRGKPIGIVMMSVIAHSYDEGSALRSLLESTFPGFQGLAAPLLTSAGRIMKTGQVAADMVMRDGRLVKNYPLFRNTQDMQNKFRLIADELKLDDDDRTEMVDAVKRWVVADFRLDPKMDPRDPEAIRLVH